MFQTVYDMLTYYGLEVTVKNRSCILSRNTLQMLLRVTKFVLWNRMESTGMNYSKYQNLIFIWVFHFFKIMEQYNET